MERCFASDNYAGVHENVFKKMMEVNMGHAASYGLDQYTKLAKAQIKERFGGECDVFFVLNGTGANITVLDALTDTYGTVICASNAHIFTHETGAPAKIAQCQLLPVETETGKLTVEGIKKYLYMKNSFHHPMPQAVSMTQPTEKGTLYSKEEIKDIVKTAKENNMVVHMDGTRLCHACASTGTSLREMTYDLGIDAVTFGLTKNGIMFGEAVVFFNRKYSVNFKHIVKQDLQLQSKMRYIGAQYLAMLENDLWRETAENAVNQAKYLYNTMKEIKEVEVLKEPEANIMFLKFPREIVEELQSKSMFYVDDKELNIARLVTSFDTKKEDVDKFAALVKALIDNKNRLTKAS